MKNKVIIIVGPTASGKTEAAIGLVGLIKSEIISCDSMQVYKDMPVLTQAPSGDDLKRIPHYLISEIAPEDEYSAAKFADNAKLLIKAILEKGKTPIIVGGTGLYVKALVDGLFPSPKKDEVFRKSLEEKAKKQGSKVLYNELKKNDPKAASKIYPNDTRRIIRALEVYHLTGIPISEHKKNTQGIKDIYDIVFLGINIPRKKLYEIINTRVEKMFRNGLIPEVKKLLKRKLSMTARSALGIKEVEGYLKNNYGLEEAKELLKKNTRRYAKKQMTWFKVDKRIRWFSEGEGIISYGRRISR